jgi:hypothetical protein
LAFAHKLCNYALTEVDSVSLIWTNRVRPLPRWNLPSKCWIVRRFPLQRCCSFWLNFPRTFLSRWCFSIFGASLRTNCRFVCMLVRFRWPRPFSLLYWGRDFLVYGPATPSTSSWFLE